MTEHANFIKDTHRVLRTTVKLKGEKHAQSIWRNHLKDKKQLKRYAISMVQLATVGWEGKMDLKSRLVWIHEEIEDYFYKGKALDKYRKEQRKASYSNIEQIEQWKEKLANDNINVLDVGSCYNPFSKFENLQVTAIDICPATPEVYQCDFLSLEISKQIEGRTSSSSSSSSYTTDEVTELTDTKPVITDMAERSFEAVIFSFLLEYIPSPKMRLDCCRKAYQLLEPNGILCIATPDSKNQNCNAQFFKFWQISLMLIGFQRIKYEKHLHFHGMVFRKAVYPKLWFDDGLKEYQTIKEKAIKDKFKCIDLEDLKTSIFILQDFNFQL